MRSASSRNHAGKEWYEELCALAAIGELSSSEFDELRKHLAECEDCRHVYADFRRVSGGDLGLVAALKQSDRTADEAGASTSVYRGRASGSRVGTATNARAICQIHDLASPACAVVWLAWVDLVCSGGAGGLSAKRGATHADIEWPNQRSV